MTEQTQPIPCGYHTMTPVLSIRGGFQALDWYRRAFGAEEPCDFRDRMARH